MAAEANKQLVREFFAGLVAGDLEKALSVTSPDFCWTIIGDTVLSGRYRGHDEIRAFLGAAFEVLDIERGIDLEVQQLIAEGDAVVARLQGKAWARDGQPYDNTYCHVFEAREGKLQSNTEYLDTALIARVWGHPPE